MKYFIRSWIVISWLTIAAQVSAQSIDLTRGYSFDDINLFRQQQRIACYHDSGTVKNSDTFVLKNHSTLFEELSTASGNNVAKNSKTVLWLSFSLDTNLNEDHIIKCLPYYQQVTLYYYSKDSTLLKQSISTKLPFEKWQYKSNMYLFKLPHYSINKYFLKFELNEAFPIGAFQIITYENLVNFNFYNYLIYISLLSCIALMTVLGITYSILNAEFKNIYYALYALFFGVFTISSYHLWPLFITVDNISHSYYIYYIPFSLSTIFFSLYVVNALKSQGETLKGLIIIYLLLLIKSVTVIWPIIGPDIEKWVHSIFNKLDVVIYFVLTFIVLSNTKTKNSISKYWLLIGLIVLCLSQFLHIFYNLSHWTFIIMFFDLLWFGVGLSIDYKVAKTEKINALQEIISIKTEYNNDLEMQVAERTNQLNKNLQTIEELNNILKENNISLNKSVETLEHERILNKEVGIEEFKAQFPDKEACLKLLARLKWPNDFVCNVCGTTTFFSLSKIDPYLKKCTQCGKSHSATTNTLFHNIKFPLEKAFYIAFLTTSNKKYGIEEISDSIKLRAATVWNFKKKVEEAMEAKKFGKNKGMTWQDLIL